MRFSRNVLRSAHICHAFLSQCLACGSIQMSCVRSAPVMRSCRNVLRSITPAVCRIAPNRTACGMFRSYSAVGRDRRSRVLESMVRLSDFVGSLRACAFLYGDPDGERKGRGNAENGGNGERSRRRGRVRFCVTALALPCFPRGVRWGLRAPKPAPKSHWLSGLSSFDSRRGRALRGEGHSEITRTCASLPPWCIIKINTLPKRGGFSRWRARTERNLTRTRDF